MDSHGCRGQRRQSLDHVAYRIPRQWTPYCSISRYDPAQPSDKWPHSTIAGTGLSEALGGNRQGTCGPAVLTGNRMGSEVPGDDLQKCVLCAGGFCTEVCENLQCPQRRRDVVAGRHANDRIDQLGGRGAGSSLTALTACHDWGAPGSRSNSRRRFSASFGRFAAMLMSSLAADLWSLGSVDCVRVAISLKTRSIASSFALLRRSDAERKRLKSDENAPTKTRLITSQSSGAMFQRACRTSRSAGFWRSAALSAGTALRAAGPTHPRQNVARETSIGGPPLVRCASSTGTASIASAPMLWNAPTACHWTAGLSSSSIAATLTASERADLPCAAA
jgi:hypothetical protein